MRDHWKRAVDGVFGKAKDWKGGVAPGPNDAALLEAAGADFTVTNAKTETVESIQLAANATLNITAHTFTATEGTGVGANAGTIGIYGTATLALGGEVDNSGVISLNGANGQTSLTTLSIASNTTLSGGGQIDLTDSLFNIIAGNGATLTNVDNTISGAGYIGATKKGLNLVNESGGVIDATGVNALVISSNSGKARSVTNDGLVEATGSGGLLFGQMKISGSGGRVVAASGAGVGFVACTVSGQSFSTQVGGSIGLAQSIANVVTPVVNAGTLEVEGGKGSVLTIDSTVNNTGELIVNRGILIVEGAVTGAGYALIFHGEMEFDSAFSQNVEGYGSLVLGDSQGYGGTISGLLRNRGDTLDLRDIGFVDAGEATFSGTAAGGVLTVSDGTHTATIKFSGDYLTTQFTASSDGQGGTIVVGVRSREVSPHGFIAAMASVAGPAGDAGGYFGQGPMAHNLVLASPHVMSA